MISLEIEHKLIPNISLPFLVINKKGELHGYTQRTYRVR